MEASKINLESLSEQEKESGIKKLTCHGVSCMSVNWKLKLHPHFCTVRTTTSVVLGHQSTQSLSRELNPQDSTQRIFYYFFLVFFFQCQKLANIIPCTFSPFFMFYPIDFIRNCNFHDHQVLWISMWFELLSHLNTLKWINKNPT